MSVRLIINGDDFGQSPAVNAGIIAAHGSGLLRSTSLMACGDAAAEAAALALATPSLDVGVHLTLTELIPLSRPAPRSRLVDPATGRMHASYLKVFALVSTRLLPLGDIAAEWRAQIRWVIAQGIRPSHLDTHQHVQIHPLINRIFLELAREFAIPAVRVPIAPLPWPRGFSARYKLRALMLLPVALLGLWQRRCMRASPHGPSGLLGFLASGQLDTHTILAETAALTSGVWELMCHPGAENEPGIGYFRARELAALQSPELQSALLSRHIEIISYGDFSRPHAPPPGP